VTYCQDSGTQNVLNYGSGRLLVSRHGEACGRAFPSFGYNDTRGAIRWVYATFGSLELFSAPDSGKLVHVQLQPVRTLSCLSPSGVMREWRALKCSPPPGKVSTCMLTTSTRISNGRDQRARRSSLDECSGDALIQASTQENNNCSPRSSWLCT